MVDDLIDLKFTSLSDHSIVIVLGALLHELVLDLVGLELVNGVFGTGGNIPKLDEQIVLIATGNHKIGLFLAETDLLNGELMDVCQFSIQKLIFKFLILH